MKNIIKFFFAALVALAFAGCDKPDGPNGSDDPVLNENIKLTVTVMKVEGITANIRVESDGSDADTWYGFLTKETDVMKAYTKKVQELSEQEKIEGLSNKSSQVIQLKDLDPLTKYTYIAFGITEDGTIYGVPASAQFTTDRQRVKMMENPAWKIEYNGEDTIMDSTYKYTAKVTSTDDNMYFVTSYSKAMYELYDIADLAESDLEYYKAYVAAVQESNPNFTYADGLFKGSDKEALNIIPGDWYAIAIGVTDKGELSGLYAVSELISIPKEEPTPEYSAWIGKWTWTGANGNTATVEFVEDNPNYSYIMYGWDGYGFDPEKDPAVYVEWDSNKNSWFIYPSYIATAEFTLGDGSTAVGEMYVMGTYEDANGDKWYHGFNYPICAGMIDNNGNKVVIGYEGKDEEGNEYAISMMEYIAFIEINGQFGGSPATSTELPSFPAVVTEVVDEGEGGEGTAPVSIRKAEKNNHIVSKLSRSNKIMNEKISIR